MNPRVTKVTPRNDTKLELVFSNGERRIYDCRHLLEFGVFEELKNIHYFTQAKQMYGTVVWPHEQDVCPDTLYFDSIPIAEAVTTNELQL